METILSQSPEETKKIAARLARSKKHAFICLYGDLGSGKTVFVKGFAREMGIPEADIKSPTYTFVREYKVGRSRLYHFDFYRVEAIDDLMHHELEEIFAKKNTWILVEWPDRIEPLMPSGRTIVQLEFVNEHQRKITMSGGGETSAVQKKGVRRRIARR